MNDMASFAKLAVALAPWQQQLVFIGGWAHRLYRQHPLAASPAYLPITTLDADIAFADDVHLEGSLGAALREAGFEETLSGDHTPPVSHYRLGKEDSGFYGEFLTPLRGSGRKRDGRADATVSKSGVTAQKLRHLEVLLIHPWQIPLKTDAAIAPISLWIPNPVAFMTQKVLIRGDRLPNKRAQDVLYVHDTLELFGAELPMLAELWRQHVAGALNEKQRRSISEGVRELFGAVNDTVRDAARIPQDRTLSPERMQAVCEQALAQILE